MLLLIFKIVIGVILFQYPVITPIITPTPIPPPNPDDNNSGGLLDGIKDLFVLDKEYIKEKLENFKSLVCVCRMK